MKFIMTIEEFNDKMMGGGDSGSITTESHPPQEEKKERFFGERISELIRAIKDIKKIGKKDAS